MTFTHPEWFFLLLTIPLVIALGVFVRMRMRNRWKEIVAERLKKQLTQTRSTTRFFIAMGLSMIGLVFLITSLAMPENGEEWVEARQEGRNVLICFDVSQSMLTQDTGSGNRLSAAKGAALEIVERFNTDRIGLLIFSGETQVMVPLTIDHSFLNESISQLDPIDLSLGGSDLAQAIKDSTKILTDTDQRNNVMIILSDGEDHSSGIEAAANTAASNGVFIYTLGFGSEEGGYIQDARNPDGFFYDRRGNRVTSQLKEESLRKIAIRTEGLYAKGLGGNFLESLTQALTRMDRFEQEAGHQRIAKPVYQWFLLPGLLLIMIAFVIQRLPVTPVIAAMISMFFFSASQTEANELLDIYEGSKAASSGNHSAAARHYEKAANKAEGDRKPKLHLAAGSSSCNDENWSEAAASFSQALLTDNLELRQQAHYALANTLFYEGLEKKYVEQLSSWKEAVGHYEKSLKLGENKSAAENMEALKKFIAKLKDNPPKKPEEQPEEKPKPEEGEKKKEEKNTETKEKKKAQENDQPQKEGDQKENDKGENGQENQNQQSSPQKPKENEEQSNQPNPSQPDTPDTDDQSGNQPNSLDSQPNPSEGPEKPGQESKIEEVKPGETLEEHARRILNAQADFGGKPPKARRRPRVRPEKDW